MTKFGIVRDPNDPAKRGVDGSHAYRMLPQAVGTFLR